MKILLTILLFIAETSFSQSQCPPEGDRPKEAVASLLKNRQWFPVKDSAHQIQFEDLLKDAITDTGAVYVDAYITSAKISGLEACQCHINNNDYKDYHIFIAATQGDKLGKDNQVVEVSRYARAFNPSITFDYVKGLVGHKVRIYGYTFMDDEHKNAIGRWRGGIQEIHPVFYIDRLD